MFKWVNGVWVHDVLDPTGLPIATTLDIRAVLESLPQAQVDTITFSNGLLPDGTLATITGWRLEAGTSPPQYTKNDSAHKWGGGPAGTGGGEVKYWFDPGSQWTEAERGSFSDAFQLWSNLANISFAPTAARDDADLMLFRYGTPDYPKEFGGRPLPPQEDGAYASEVNTAGAPGDTVIPATTAGLISIETEGNFSDLGSFIVNGGYGRHTVVHEIGHSLGLDHTGPYDAVDDISDYAPFQFSAYDSYVWSVMSYIEHWNTSAPYFDQYPVKDTYWYPITASSTPMINDILAVQQLYGLPGAGAFTMPQTFGFNTTISDGSRSFYDFTVNTFPVVTIYSAAATNTLDLSGWSSGSRVNLNPASFSSGAGMVNNIAIGHGTRITGFVGGAGDDRITANPFGDTIDGGGGEDTVIYAGSIADFRFDRTGDGVSVTSTTATDTLRAIEYLRFDDATIDTDTIPCFATGTEIATPSGPVPVERLRVGLLLCTVDQGMMPVRWIGYRRIDPARHPRPETVAPVRVRAGAFGPGQPIRDLVLSPDHAIFQDGALIPVRYLLDGHAIRRDPPAPVTYWHVELGRHALILAEGLAVESYLDTGDRHGFANGGPALDLHPRFGALSGEGRCAPLMIDGPIVDATRERLRRVRATPRKGRRPA